MKKGIITAIVNQKGGTGKTTTALNLGIGLARAGQEVLLVDFDPQGDLTTALGWKNPDSLQLTISEQLEKYIRGEPMEVGEETLHHKEGVDLIPSSIGLSGLEMTLVTAFNRENTLKSYLNEIKDYYDRIIIDCSPSLGMLTINALAAADNVIIPVQTHYLPMVGMTQLIKTIGKVQRQINPNLAIDGILLTLADKRTNLSKSAEQNIRENYGRKIHIFNTVIPIAVKAAEASAAGSSIYEYDKDSQIAKAYECFTKEVSGGGKGAITRAGTSICR